MKLRETLNKFFGRDSTMTMTANKSNNYPQDVIDSMVSAYEANPTPVSYTHLTLPTSDLV